MSYQTLSLERSGEVAVLTLNRPEVGNALNLTMARELMSAAIVCDEDRGIRAVLLTGAGKMFCAGGDLKLFAREVDRLPSLLKEMTAYLHAGVSRLVRMKAPVVTAVNGSAAGAGFSLAVAADIVVAAESARFMIAYTNAGLAPNGSCTYFLPRRVGDRRAREMMLTNRSLNAREALDWGLVNRVVPDAELQADAMELATQLAAGPTRAFGAVKALLNESFEHGLESQMELEARAIAATSATRDGREGIAAFLEKRSPEFKGE